ncbi:N-acyl homoserine lactonase family protein [Ramlibacter sp.]|uniref:N-acyl homoserine lactonase family protein n=1 Tax=Ramlibacter sp. TaxID=1917967 RepID=UPI002D804C55|nr:N-acyl homoserine lactonase family protein [Ramlibacter sp.]
MTVASPRLYCFCGGYLTYDQSIMTFMNGMGTSIEVPTLFFLIDHPQGKVLFETGLHPNVATDPRAHWGGRADALKPRMRPDQSAVAQLARLGVRPDDIRYVVMSCLMYDHCGGMTSFPDATFVVQFQELQDAWWPDRRYMKSYNDAEILPTRHLRFRELHGEDLDLFGDGSVVVLSIPSHTRGEQGLVVRLARTGSVVFPAGAIPQRANLEHNIMTGTPRAGPAVAYRSTDKLRGIIERERAMVIFHHDPHEWEQIKQAPDFYD